MGSEHATLADLVLQVSASLEPPERLSVTEAAAKYVTVVNPPTYTGLYKPHDTPYMTEPADVCLSRDFTACIFVAGAQSGKSQSLILNVMGVLPVINPMDCILYHMSQPAARDFSIRRVDRTFRNSPDIKAQMMESSRYDNTFDKRFKSGMMLSISWPSINEMSSKPIPIVMFTDYDRMPEDIGGEGSPFSLGSKRTTTFRSLAMTIAESSPSMPIEKPKEDDNRDAEEIEPPGEHEAPPCKGILGLYNEGDRRRWYWPCPECLEFFEPSFALLRWATRDEDDRKLSIPQMARTTRMVCPHCEARIPHEVKEELNAKGVWLREGEKIRADGTRYGEPRESKTASFWLKGPAATFITWTEMVTKYLNAERQYELTGSEEALKSTTNLDQAEPYKPRTTEAARLADDLQALAEDLPTRSVPPSVSALFACCDTQKNRWEVQVMGVSLGQTAGTYDIFVIDRFKVEKSNREDRDGDRLWVKPASYPEDWDLLESEVMDKTYPLFGAAGEMSIAMTFVDSGGGKERSHDKKVEDIDEDMSVTSNAYAFWRRLRAKGRGDRLQLVKGDPNVMSPRAHVEYPNSERKDRHAGARGEIPVLFLNVNSLKDTLNARLDRDTGVGSRIIYPKWLPKWWFDELTAEVRGRRGWAKLGSRRNEAWDLLCYFIGACEWRRVDKVDPANPPPWLSRWDDNPYVTLSGAPVDKKVKPVDSFADLGAELA